jgi:hypothetical protein
MSMVLLALCINPLLTLLNKNLAGVCLGQSGRRTAVIAYADGVTIVVTKPDDFRIIREAVQLYETASWARLNARKSKALATGGWKRTANALRVNFHPTIKILGIPFSNRIESTMHESWALMTRRVKAQAKHAYGRDLCLAQRVRYVHISLLAITVQILPAPVTYTQQLSTAIAWFIWQGANFRVLVSTLQKPRMQGGWALLDIAIKCRALLLRRIWVQSK